MKKALILTTLLVILTACAAPAQSGITVENAWARAASQSSASDMGSHSENMDNSGSMGEGENSMGGLNSAIYMVIYNQSNQNDRLIAAKTDVAESVEIHQTRMENDIMMMQKVDGVDIPANSKVELKPGGYHIMLINLKKDLRAGEKLAFTLVFEKQGEINLEAEVRTP
jgi:copper(I)-binding protein